MNARIISALLAIGMTSTAWAGEGGWFGVSLGQSDLDITADDLNDGSFYQASEDSKGQSFRLAGGFDFSDRGGIEMSYVDLGEGTVTAASWGGFGVWLPGKVDATITGTGITVGGNGYLPLDEKVHLVGKLGFLMWDAEGTATNGPIRVSVSDDGSDLYFGVGLEAHLGRNVSAGISYTSLPMDDVDSSNLSLDLRYRLGN